MSKHNPNLWENDPSLVPKTAARKAVIFEGVFDYYADQKLTPEQAYPDAKDADEKAAYAKWLEANPIEA